jgi:hypothetical protein
MIDWLLEAFVHMYFTSPVCKRSGPYLAVVEDAGGGAELDVAVGAQGAEGEGVGAAVLRGAAHDVHVVGPGQPEADVVPVDLAAALLVGPTPCFGQKWHRQWLEIRLCSMSLSIPLTCRRARRSAAATTGTGAGDASSSCHLFRPAPRRQQQRKGDGY